MNLNDYQEFVEGLASGLSTANFESRLSTSALGLAGESGEVADIIKKHLFHGKDLNKEELLKELGDLCWYLAFAANTLGVSLQSIFDGNVDKLKDRYKTGKFTIEEFMKKENKKENVESSK